MSGSACRSSKWLALLALAALGAAWDRGAVGQALAQTEPAAAPSAREAELAERAELFVALLKRRAQRILESRRPPPPPFLSVHAGAAHGYESNVNLAGIRKGDYFAEQSFELNVRPRLTGWLEGELSYSGLATEFYELTDSNLTTHTVKSALELKPYRRVELALTHELGLLNFPRDTPSSFRDQRFKAELSLAQTDWLTHRAGWGYQYREYDTRLARDSAGDDLAGLVREDRRHSALYQLRLQFAKTFLKLAAEFYRNFSNDHSNDFYDWEDLRLQGVVTRVLRPKWLAVGIASHERKNYLERSVPAINIAERDNLLTLGGSLVWQITEKASVSYSLTYRYQDSNDPRLDFTDWVHQVGVSVSF